MHYDKDIRHHAIPITPAPNGFDQVPPRSLYRSRIKPVFDICAIVLAAPVVIPLIGLLALLVACDGRSPFYRQKRVGLHGRIYTMWKLRTMVPDADARLARHLRKTPAARVEWHRTQKLEHDPRITPVGRILRKTSLDELPQLLNVLQGDMSLVGPRPILPDQQALYHGTDYYHLRPGMTGPWQVSARNATPFAQRAIYDTRYARTCHFRGDVKLLVATIGVVIRATGH